MEHERRGEGEGEGGQPPRDGRGGGGEEHPPRAETGGTASPDEDEQAAAARRGVGLACNFCRRSHTICETKRPCTRCEKAGRAHLCSDVPLRKRGRPRRSDSAAKDNTNHNNKLTHAQHQHKQRQPPSAAAPPQRNQPPQPLFPGAATTANAPLGLDTLPFFTISPRTPPVVVTVRPSPPPAVATSASAVQAIAPKLAPAPPKPTAAAHSSPAPTSNSALFSSALDMVSDELRRAREENEKLRVKLRKTKAKLKRKKAEAKQLRRALAQEIDDKAVRHRQELAVVAAATTPRIMATRASMHASWSTASSDTVTVLPHSSRSSPPSASTSGSGSASCVSSPLPVSSYSTPHAFPISVMEHVHQCLPFLSAYLFSPRDFVVKDLRHPMLAFDMGNVMDPTIIYANPVLCQLLGFSPRPGFPLMKLWADSKNCEKQMPLLMETQPSMYISEFIFADPLLRCVNGFHVRASFLMQFFFDRRGRIKYGVACAESWHPDVPRDNESLREWNDDLHDHLLGALDGLVADDDQPFMSSGGSGGDDSSSSSFTYAADHFDNSNGGWPAQQDYDLGQIDHLPSTFMEEVTFAMHS